MTKLVLLFLVKSKPVPEHVNSEFHTLNSFICLLEITNKWKIVVTLKIIM